MFPLYIRLHATIRSVNLHLPLTLRDLPMPRIVTLSNQQEAQPRPRLLKQAPPQLFWPLLLQPPLRRSHLTPFAGPVSIDLRGGQERYVMHHTTLVSAAENIGLKLFGTGLG